MRVTTEDSYYALGVRIRNGDLLGAGWWTYIFGCPYATVDHLISIVVRAACVMRVGRKDVRLPVQLQRAMAAEAEAAREARAKVKTRTSQEMR